jgi:hypothetical protein
MNANPKTDTKPSPHHAPQREDRVAGALRENLRKRKQQQQDRSLSDAQKKDE